jgi:hypothetical protein
VIEKTTDKTVNKYFFILFVFLIFFYQSAKLSKKNSLTKNIKKNNEKIFCKEKICTFASRKKKNTV